MMTFNEFLDLYSEDIKEKLLLSELNIKEIVYIINALKVKFQDQKFDELFYHNIIDDLSAYINIPEEIIRHKRLRDRYVLNIIDKSVSIYDLENQIVEEILLENPEISFDEYEEELEDRKIL